MKKMIIVLGAAAAVGAAAGLDTDVKSANPAYNALHAKALELADRNIEKLGGGWKPQMTCMPGVGIIWQWDSCFMSLFAGYTRGDSNGLGNLDNLYSMQGEDGYISMAYTYETRKPTWPGRINPPLYAWCEWLYARRTGDLSRLPRAYEVCSKYFRWLKANRTRKINGLYYFEDSGSSGMDNSPRCGYFAEHQKGSDVCFVDLCCQQVLHARCLAKIAPLVGKASEAAKWEREANDLAARINDYMWSDRTDFYHDVYIDTNNRLAVKTAAAFWAIVSGVADASRTARLAEHLENPSTFGSEFPVPSLSRDDPNYDPRGGYWLGGVWPPAMYMIVRGLRERGYRDLARELAVKHLDQMCAVMEADDFDGKNTIWECYSPEVPAPSTDKIGRWARPDFVGWGGLGPLVMLVEDILGLDIDALDKRIEWHPVDLGVQGVKDVPFNGGKVTLSAEVTLSGEVKVTVDTDREFTLKVYAPDRRKVLVKRVRPGKATYSTAESYSEQDRPLED